MVFLVIDLTWRLFRQTGNIEAYLLFKELENGMNEQQVIESDSESNETKPVQSHL